MANGHLARQHRTFNKSTVDDDSDAASKAPVVVLAFDGMELNVIILVSLLLERMDCTGLHR